MKWVAKLLCVCVLSALMALGASAAETTTYTIEEANLSVEVPEEFVVFTRQTEAEDAAYAVCGRSKMQQMQYMKDTGAYLNIWSSDSSYEITLTVAVRNYPNLNDLQEEDLQKLVELQKEDLADSDIVNPSCVLYDHPQTKFLKITYPATTAEDRFCGEEFLTTYNGKDIGILLYSRTGVYDEEMEAALKLLVDSIRFDDHAANTYYAGVLGMTLDVPDGYAVYAKDMEVGDSSYSGLDLPEEYWRVEGKCFEAFSEDLTHTITIFATDVDELDFREYSDEELMEFISSRKETYTAEGCLLTKTEVCDHDQTRFVRCMVEPASADKGYYGIQYVTALEGKALSISLIALEHEFPETYHDLIEQIVGSIRFTELSAEDPQAEDVPENDITDSALFQEIVAEQARKEAHRDALLRGVLFVLFGFTAHCLPVFYYRYIIRKSSVQNAAPITIVYALAFATIAVTIFAVIGPNLSNLIAFSSGIVMATIANFFMLSK